MLFGRSPKAKQRNTPDSVPTYSLEQLSSHHTKDDIWMAIHNRVYDVTPFLDRHPGGAEVLLDCAGVDATAYFDDVGHSEDSKIMLRPLFRGNLAEKDCIPNDTYNADEIMHVSGLATEDDTPATTPTDINTENKWNRTRRALGNIITAIASNNEELEAEIRRALRDNKNKSANRIQPEKITTTTVTTKKRRLKRRKKHQSWQELTYIILTIVALFSACSFFYLQQRKWQ